MYIICDQLQPSWLRRPSKWQGKTGWFFVPWSKESGLFGECSQGACWDCCVWTFYIFLHSYIHTYTKWIHNVHIHIRIYIFHTFLLGLDSETGWFDTQPDGPKAAGLGTWDDLGIYKDAGHGWSRMKHHNCHRNLRKQVFFLFPNNAERCLPNWLTVSKVSKYVNQMSHANMLLLHDAPLWIGVRDGKSKPFCRW